MIINDYYYDYSRFKLDLTPKFACFPIPGDKYSLNINPSAAQTCTVLLLTGSLLILTVCPTSSEKLQTISTVQFFS